MRHNIPRPTVLKLIVKEIKYHFDFETNKELLDKLGYSSPTYLSDIYSGKTPVSDKFVSKLEQSFMINPEVFSGASCEMFLPSSPFHATLTSSGGVKKIPGKKNTHIHYGDTKAESGGTAIEHLESTGNIPNGGSEIFEKILQLQKETVNCFKEIIESNNQILKELNEQKTQFHALMLSELKSQREFFMQCLTIIKDKLHD